MLSQCRLVARLSFAFVYVLYQIYRHTRKAFPELLANGFWMNLVTLRNKHFSQLSVLLAVVLFITTFHEICGYGSIGCEHSVAETSPDKYLN